ncbi:MAG: organic solvent tolerance ABC transporter substrate-binding protein [Candidatus Rokuibacteriota bacterium]|nr:MAG: organic solvent tolerance ABC transporter substrate-binding protein [Candidatus Rokubacteria bacterium]PYN70774.1 MAG: organic solvent tolerance ABC transporter substrate-binding protein [Candidatus Rokubacteria bacterium]
MRLQRSVIAVAALWLGAVLAAPAWAGQPADQLSASIDRIIKILNDPELKRPAKAKQRQAAVRRMASEVFDFEEFARRSLGRHWDARTPAEQAEFVQLFRLLLERVLTGKLDLYDGEKIVVVGDVIDGVRGDEATVKMLVGAKQGAVPLDFWMVQRGSHWRACDIVIGGVSLVRNYRAQFDKVIKRTSYQQLVKQVREK